MSTTQQVNVLSARAAFDWNKCSLGSIHREEGWWPYGIGLLYPGDIFGCRGMPPVVVSRDGDNFSVHAKFDLRVSMSRKYKDVDLSEGESLKVHANERITIKWQCPETGTNTLTLTIFFGAHYGGFDRDGATPNTATGLPSKRPRTRAQTLSGVVPVQPTKKLRRLPPVVTTSSVDTPSVDPSVV
jgi:hypothetical protein